MNITYTNESVRNTNLPKWPALIVVGERVTPQQAAEILIRTDSSVPDFSFAGNDRRHAAQLNALFGNEMGDGFDVEVAMMQEHWDKMERLRQRMGILRLSYLNNHQIVSAYIGGPHGWCNWNGDIFSNSYNIGKWPSVEEVASDWAEIAQAFPYLNLRAQLFSGETCEDATNPVVEFLVKTGNVVVSSPTSVLCPPVSDLERSLTSLFSGGYDREHGISVRSLGEKLKQVYGEIPQL